MITLNRVQILGRVGADPELRQTRAGGPVLSLSVATDRKRRSETGDAVRVAQWHRIVVFGNLATASAQALKKGSSVYLDGELQTNEYTDRDGVECVSTEILARRIIFLDHQSEPSSRSTSAGQHRDSSGTRATDSDEYRSRRTRPASSAARQDSSPPVEYTRVRDEPPPPDDYY